MKFNNKTILILPLFALLFGLLATASVSAREAESGRSGDDFGRNRGFSQRSFDGLHQNRHSGDDNFFRSNRNFGTFRRFDDNNRNQGFFQRFRRNDDGFRRFDDRGGVRRFNVGFRTFDDHGVHRGVHF